MKRIYLFSFALFLFFGSSAQSGYSIRVTVKPYRDTLIYLGYYYGKKTALADSVKLDNQGQGSFHGKEKLPGGIYFIVSPRKQILFEMLIDQQQQFSVFADTSDLSNSLRFENSPDNDLFRAYTAFTNKAGSEINRLNLKLASTKKRSDSTSFSRQIKNLGDEVQLYRDSLVQKHPASILAALLKAIREPVVPPATMHPGGKYDSDFAYRYYKAHYWEGVEFDDGRLVRTPFFESKLDRYFKTLVAPVPDSITREADHMILFARTNREMYKFLLVYFVQKYINPDYMGQDAVFVYLWEKYINTGLTDFFTEQYKEYMTKRAYSIMANLIGNAAANLEMVDSLDRPRPLYDITADFIVICFWDPTCSHCKETVPKVDSIFRAKWKNEGVVLYGVMVDGGKDNWKTFIRENHLDGWVHVYQLPQQAEADNASSRPGYRQLYDVYQTPILYLLDRNKKIVAKKLTYQQLDEIIDLKIKNSHSN